MNTKALKLAAVAATMLEDFTPTQWVPLPSLGLGVRVLLDDGQQQLVATAQTSLDRSADTGSAAEAARIYDTMYPHAGFTWPHLRAIIEVEADYFDTSAPITVTLIEPLPGAPVGDQAIADIARASSLAQALATLHSAAPESISEAGFPVEDPSRFQFQILERLDQAAATGRVPADLLQHWEEEFERVSLWRFLATPIHGAIDETSVYTDQERVLALSGIERLRVSDPAIDLAAASALIDPAAVPTFFSEYRNSRPRADEHVITRAELLAEFAVLDWLLEAVDSGDEEAVQDAGELLSSFNDVLFAKDAAAPDAASPGPAAESSDHGSAPEANVLPEESESEPESKPQSDAGLETENVIDEESEPDDVQTDDAEPDGTEPDDGVHRP